MQSQRQTLIWFGYAPSTGTVEFRGNLVDLKASMEESLLLG